MKKLFFILFAFCVEHNAHAFAYVYVPNMSQLSWQLATDGKAYLRNLNQFSGAFSGCCYNYWVDTTTPAGKAIWSSILLKIATAQTFYLGLSDPAQGGQIEHVGIW